MVTGPSDLTAEEFLRRQRALMRDRGWELKADRLEPEATVADSDEVPDFVRFGPVDAMKRVAMDRGDRKRIKASRAELERSIIVQLSPPEETEIAPI